MCHEWDGWGRLSDDGRGRYNPDPSEDPWGGGLHNLHGGALTRNRPDTERDDRCYYVMAKAPFVLKYRLRFDLIAAGYVRQAR